MNASSSSFNQAADPDTRGMDGRDARIETNASIGTLVRQLMHETPALLSKELALAKSEAREGLRSTREGMMAVAAGGIVLMGGYLILLLSAVYGLSQVMEPWLAALIVGLVAAAVGFAMVSAGKHKFTADGLKPEHTMRTLRKDADVVRGRTP